MGWGISHLTLRELILIVMSPIASALSERKYTKHRCGIANIYNLQEYEDEYIVDHRLLEKLKAWSHHKT